MKHEPITAQHFHSSFCDCRHCNPHRVIDARRLIGVTLAIFAPIVALTLAVWTVLPR